MLPKIDIGSELIEIKPDSILTLKTYNNINALENDSEISVA